MKPAKFKRFEVVEGVAPLAGAWIETRIIGQYLIDALVAPLAGAWIETTLLVSPSFPS